MLVSGWTLSGLTIVFCAMDAVMKLVHPSFVIDATNAIGWPADPGMLTVLGVLLLASIALYAAPATAVLGAIVLTGYLGGTVAAHARHLDPLFSHDLFGVYLGICAWGGLWLREERVRDLIPLRRRASSR